MFWFKNLPNIKKKKKKKMAYTAKDPRPPRLFLYLTETKSWWCGEEEEGEGEEG